MVGQDQIDKVFGRDVYGSDGERIGAVKQVYTDDETGRPEWASVSTGLFGTKETFVPLADADLSGDGVSVPFTKTFVKDAPNIDDDGHLSPEEEQQLYSYYDRTDYDTPTGGAAHEEPTDQDRGIEGAVGHDTSGPTTDDAMTVSGGATPGRNRAA